MKYLTGLILAGLIAGNVYAQTYEYENVEGKVKITSTETIVEVDSETYTIEELEEKIAVCEASIVNTLTYYNENTARLNAEIVIIKEQIIEAQKLGVSKKEKEPK